MDSNNLLTDFLDNYFNEPLSDDKDLKPRKHAVSSSLLLPQFCHDGPNSDSSMNQKALSTPNHHQYEKKPSPCYEVEVNYGPILSHVEALTSSVNPHYFERMEPNTALDDFFNSPRSSSSSTISIRSPIPPPTPSPFSSPERPQCISDINNNSNETISADEDDTSTPDLIIEESQLSPQPSPLLLSASPLVTFTIPDQVPVNGIRRVVTNSEDVLEHHFDVQLSPAMAATCTDTSHNYLSEEQSTVCRQEPIEIPRVPTESAYLNISSPRPGDHLSPRDVTSSKVAEDKILNLEEEGRSTVPISSHKFADLVFKTDLTRFSSKPSRQVNVAAQSGQNVIPLAKERNPRDRLWHVDQDDLFRDVPVVKDSPEPKKKKGMSRCGKNKRVFAEEALTPGGMICARCVELSQQLR